MSILEPQFTAELPRLWQSVRYIAMTAGGGNVTRIMRLRIPVLDGKEWVSVLPGPDPEHVLVIRESSEEIQIRVESDAPLEPQISKELANLTPEPVS